MATFVRWGANMTASFIFRTVIILLVACLAADCALANSIVTVPIRLLQHFPVLSANIGGEPVFLQFDSGNSGSVALTQAVIDKLKAVPAGEFSQGLDGKGNVMKYPKYKIPEIKIGAVTFSD